MICVETTAGEVRNDALVIASGGRFIKKLPGIEHAILPCEGIAPVERLRERLAALQSGTVALGFAGNPNEPSAMRGGPVFEFLFGIDTQLRREGRRERIKLAFFNPMPNPGHRLGEKALKRLMAEMQRREIDIHLGHKLLGFESGKVKTEGGEFAADIIVFMPGMEEGLFPHQRALEEHAEDEERRLFYVALTRARQDAVLTYAETRRIRGDMVRRRPSPFLDEIPPELVEFTTPAKSLKPASPEVAANYLAQMKAQFAPKKNAAGVGPLPPSTAIDRDRPQR